MVGATTLTEDAAATAAERPGHDRCPVLPPRLVDPSADTGYDAGDFVTEHSTGCRQLAGQVQIAPTDPTTGDMQEGLTRTGSERRHLSHFETGSFFAENHRSHRISSR
jgi:hypothetical protein